MLLAMSMAGSLASAAEIRSMRVSAEADATRAVLDVSAPVQYKLLTLQNPDRLVLDISASTLAAGFDPAAGSGVLKGVRTGKQGKDLRVVFDLNGGVRPKTFLLPPDAGAGHRLVIDLQPVAGQANASAPAPAVRTVASAVPDTERKIVVAIDAGHGGKDPGARGPTGSWEKDIVLQVARELAKQIDAEPGFESFLVRDGDYYIVHQERYEKARKAGADLFISVHADAFYKPTANGSSVFVLSTRGASGEAARWLADRENRDLVGGVSLDDKDNTLAAVLLDLSQSATMKASDDIANHVLDAMKRVGKTHKPHVERANFIVLRSPDVPSLLVETGFISNPAEEKKLKDPAHRRKLAAAVVDGVRDYFSAQPPPGTWLASNATARPRQVVVGRGDTLSQIATRHGVSLTSLRAANGIKGDTLKAGARLTIPLAMNPE
ncbi:N-acetylmuramoyl-L-alanine amidase [Chiayiivirga flava]|uniref:N-acetylmuramoyl-L-alanine amidase AmiC n=1 Tax=Chiayiivirga flava TaxID=659595 RepID=A0A7W8D5D1_9GAMM|nr:N-acetylmuramoyl-L-alanine amidase [Chiayiivirga flava]